MKECEASSNLITDIPKPGDLVDAHRVQVLVTGSLHLVGGVIACIQVHTNTIGLVERRFYNRKTIARHFVI